MVQGMTLRHYLQITMHLPSSCLTCYIHSGGDQFDCVVGIDALGFILGTAVAIHSKKAFVPIRKGGKLPVVSDAIGFVDYTGQVKSLELRKGAITPGTRVLLVDEWIETGSQVKAAVELIER